MKKLNNVILIPIIALFLFVQIPASAQKIDLSKSAILISANSHSDGLKTTIRILQEEVFKRTSVTLSLIHI